MVSQPIRIPVRSRRQAMDWSLVLVSQGIETTIDPPTNELGWGLVIRREDHPRAVETIEKYRAENRGWHWSQQRIGHGLLFDWTSAVWILLLAFCYWFSVENTNFQDTGIFSSSAFADGQWWRAFTAIMLHEDLKHLASNCAFGLLLLGLTMGFYGTGIGLLAAFLAGAGGNLVGFFVYGEPHFGLGASGMALGSLGLLAAQWFVLARKNPRAGKLIFAGIFGAICLLVLFGFSPGTDVIAHVGGFFTGLLLGCGLAFVPAKWRRSPALNLAGGLLLAGLIILCWAMAMRAAQ